MIGLCVGSLVRWVIIVLSVNIKQVLIVQSYIKFWYNNWGDQDVIN